MGFNSIKKFHTPADIHTKIFSTVLHFNQNQWTQKTKKARKHHDHHHDHHQRKSQQRNKRYEEESNEKFKTEKYNN